MKQPSFFLDIQLMGNRLASVSLTAREGEGFHWSLSSPHREIEEWLEEYGLGRVEAFPPLFDLSAMTPFSQKVLEACRLIPFGEKVTYAGLAELAGVSPLAARAVGSVMAKNPFPLFIPCHRVVARHGLGGYGPGLSLKKELLAYESTLRDCRDSQD